ncbi:hypothetical protein ACKKBF_B37180 [Auxenochlorella protothecoides x Auxenochlorella symbiontica]
MADLLTLAWKRYLYGLHYHPIKTKAVTAGTLAALADLVSQRIAGAGSIKWRRTALLALYGLLYSGPCSHFWQYYLEKLFPDKQDPLRIVKKVVVDQLVYAPFQNVVVLAYLAKVVEGLPLVATIAKLKVQWPTVQAMGWRFWPLAQYINQKYFPLQLRVMWLNIVAFLWGIFIMVSSRSSPLPAVIKKV